jgi:Ca2+-binding RTX toxin-like protein
MQFPRLGLRALLVLLVGVGVLTLATPAFAVSDRGCTITGTRGNDTLIGKTHGDVICGLPGNDRLRGRRGGDTLYGGLGNDRLRGGKGSDTFYGGRGDDRLNSRDGVSGNDTVNGRLGFDVCFVDKGDLVTGCEVVHTSSTR